LTSDVQEHQLASQEGIERRFVSVRIRGEAIEVDAQDLGPTVKEIWGDSDYEFGVTIEAADLARFAFALIVQHYSNDLDAVDKIKELAVKSGIDPHFWTHA
jgi:hypothetical protein